ncbi:MAG: hypothetical protein LM578_07120 [Desulfurococcaceae archaeon]|nr:hypothetical protein [Desulfurococcaceae archaeon]
MVVRKVYVEILSRALVLVVVTPLLVRVLEGFLLLFEGLGGFSFIERLSPDTVVPVVFMVFQLFSLTLLVLSVVFLEPILYSLSLLPLAVVGFDVGVISSFYIVSTLLILHFLSVTLQGYREGQFSAFRVRGFPALVISLFSLAVMVVALSYAVSLLSWSYIEALRSVSVKSAVLKPLVSFLSGNPLGNVLVLALILSAFYQVVINVSETLSLYLKPSRDVAVKALTLDPYTPIKPPLTSIRNAMITLAVSPVIYTLLILALERLGLLTQYDGGFQLYNTLARWAIAVVTLTVTWLLLTRALTRFDEREPGLGGLIAGLTLIILLYTLLYTTGLWNPGEEGLSLTRADQYVASMITGYYKTLLSILEIAPMLIGLAP